MDSKNVNDEEFISIFDSLNFGHLEGEAYCLNPTAYSISHALKEWRDSISKAAAPPQTQRDQYYCNLPPSCTPVLYHQVEVELNEEIIIDMILNRRSLHLVACDYKDSLVLRETINKNKKSRYLMANLSQNLALNFFRIACNRSGVNVVRDCFMELRPPDNEALCEQMTEHYFNMATDQLGCYLLNDCMPYMGSFYMESIFTKIVTDCQVLAQHRYGTYVVQNAIRVQHKKYTLPIVENLKSIILTLATQREGSHLVEKCLVYSPTKRIVMEELTNLKTAELRCLASHEFGNFVVQKALEPSIGWESPEIQRLTFVLSKALRPLRNDLRWHPNGKNVYKKQSCSSLPC